MTKLLLVISIWIAFPTSASADGYCAARDRSDHFWRSVCSRKNETLCNWEENCRWAYTESGTCQARDASDHFWRSVCSRKNEALCNWEENCVWND